MIESCVCVAYDHQQPDSLTVETHVMMHLNEKERNELIVQNDNTNIAGIDIWPTSY